MSARWSMPRFRLLDAVVLAAVAMLGLKVLGLFTAIDAGSSTKGSPADVAPKPLPTFGRVLAQARSNFPIEPATTGSIEHKAAAESAPAKDTASAAIRPVPLSPPSPSEKALLERLGERREELQQRTREMESRERLMEEQERRLDDTMGRLKGSEPGQNASASAQGDAEASALKNIVLMYEAMKPKEAARVFERLPLDVLVSVATGMNTRKAAEILAAMSPQMAEKLTVALAARARGQTSDRLPGGASALPAGELPAIEPSAVGRP